MYVPLLDLNRQYEPMRAQLAGAILNVLDSGQFILGPDVAALEKDVARLIGSSDSVGVSNGTDALVVALRALGIGVGDKVLTTSFTFFATLSAVVSVGAQPVFADIDENTFNIDPSEVDRILSADTTIKAVIPVHLYGQAADMQPILASAKAHKVAVIEDAAQAIGTYYKDRHVGTLGDFGAFSFFPTKNLGGFGDSGLVIASSEQMTARARSIRTHGSTQRYYHDYMGGNFRIDTVQAAFLRQCLPMLPKWIAQRQQIAAAYDEGLGPLTDRLTTPVRAADTNHTFHQYTLRVHNNARDSLQNFLTESQIATSIYYPVPCHLQNAVKCLNLPKASLPKTQTAAKEVLSIPIFPGMTQSEVDYVIDRITYWARL